MSAQPPFFIPDGKVYRPYRTSFEGVLHIPSTPLIIGFNANLKLQSSPKGYFDPRDDLRILFGTRFDVGKLFAKLLTFKTGN